MQNKQKILIYLACILLFSAVGNALVQGQAWERREYDLARTHYYPYGSTSVASLNDFTPLWSAPVSAELALTGDINGDGKLEVIAWDRPNLRVYDSEGHDLWNVTISGSPTGAMDPVLLDVTGDSIPEIAISRLTSPGDLLQILVYDGSGSLLKTISRSGCPHSGIYPWLAGDLNNDGEIEILAALDAGYCRYPRGVSLFDFETGQELWHYAIGPQSGGLSVGDIDEDNDLEFVRGGGTPHNGTVGCGVNNQATCTNDGNVATIVAEAGSGSEVFTRTYGAANGWLFHAIVDLDHDGDSHILCFRGYDNYYPGTMSVFLLDDQGNTTDTWTYPGPETNRRVNGSWAIADIDNDNLEEIILCDQAPNSDHALRILQDDLTQQLPAVENLVNAVGNRVFIVVADISGDGLNDILVTDQVNGKLRILDNSLTQVWSYDLANILHVALSDLNDDGIPEIILSGESLVVLSASDKALAVVEEGAKAYLDTILPAIGLEPVYSTTFPPDMSEYCLVICQLYGACNPQSATYIENYINSGGGAIVTDGAPYFLAGQSRNLSSIKHWFGAGYYPNDNDTVSVIVDHPFGTPLVSGDTLHQDYPRCNWGAAASDLQMGAHPVAQYRGRCGNNIAAFYYTYGSGKVYFSYTLFYPHENHTVLLKAAMEWANACKVEGPGSVSGAVSDSLGGVLGVTVDLFDSTGSLAEFTYTDVSGFFEFDSVDPGDYTVSIVTPLGYVADFESRPVTVTMNADSVVNFTLHRLEMVPSQRSMGYWKHQVNVHLSGKGHAQESQTDMSNYMSLIEEHFNDNLANSITIFEVPQPATQTDSLEALKDLLTVKGNAGMNAKARQQLMALLLNVVSLKLDQTASISEDSANVSQAITYSNQVITDSDPTNDEIAKDIADQINNGVLVASGIIPLTTPDIIYKGTEDQIAQTPSRPKQFSLEQNYPNPFNPACNIEYALPTDCQVTLSIYNILGQKVRVLVDEYQSTGNKSVTWDGKDDQGQEVTSGVYFYRIQAGDFVQSKKMVLIK